MIEFSKLPRREKEYVIESFGLHEREARMLRLRYVEDMDYSRIAAEMHMSKSSVGPSLTRARAHTVDIAKHLYPIADDRLKHIIDSLGWVELEWPVTESRRTAR